MYLLYIEVCPSGIAIRDIPQGKITAANPDIHLTMGAHSQLAECSNAGICNRELGSCECFPPYTGSACDKC